MCSDVIIGRGVVCELIDQNALFIMALQNCLRYMQWRLKVLCALMQEQLHISPSSILEPLASIHTSGSSAVATSESLLYFFTAFHKLLR